MRARTLREWLPLTLATLSLAGWLLACQPSPQDTQSTAPKIATAPSNPTFSDHVWPILERHCASCHRAGQSAPFALLTFQDAVKRAEQIIEVVESGYMPPWLPSSENPPFKHQRELYPQEIETLVNWVANGLPEGTSPVDSGHRQSENDWELGPPDLIVDLEQPYRLPAEGADVYRNFVLATGLSEPSWVTAVEIKPSDPERIHHVVLLTDDSGYSRQLDAQTEETGFGGDMSAGNAALPGGQFFGWTPGKRASRAIDGTAWLIGPNTDLITQVHMRPSGKPEDIGLKVALYFSDETPRFQPYPLVLRNKAIDIPAGESSYRLTQSYKLPVDVILFGVYPHAHYLAKEMWAYATRPDGSRINLLHIDRWDFNWQDEYRYVQPLNLPKDSVVHMDYTYDNSAANPFNPNSPPKRVSFGQNSTDEMGEIIFQLSTRTPDDLHALGQDVALRELSADADRKQRELEKTPNNDELRLAYSERLMQLGDLQKAANQLLLLSTNVATPKPIRLTASRHMGDLAIESGQYKVAAQYYYTLTQLAPDSPEALFLFGDISARLNKIGTAVEYLQRAVNTDDNYLPALTSLASLLLSDEARNLNLDDVSGAVNLTTRANELTAGQSGPILELLADALKADGEMEQAKITLEKAIEVAKQSGDNTILQRLENKLKLTMPLF